MKSQNWVDTLGAQSSLAENIILTIVVKTYAKADMKLF